jgi:hypothetical protein
MGDVPKFEIYEYLGYGREIRGLLVGNSTGKKKDPFSRPSLWFIKPPIQ